MKTTVEPPFDQWKVAGGVVATGHQAALWHPGIFIKYAAVVAAAERFGAQPMHLVVDQDQHEAVTLDLPQVENGRLSVRTLRLGDENSTIPTGMQPPIDAAEAVARLNGIEPLRSAFASLGTYDTLAQQVAALLETLLEPYVGRMRVVYASRLLRDSTLVDDLVADAREAVAQYNRAVAAHPDAGIVPLSIRGERIELPLWRLLWRRSRRRVFLDGGVLTDELREPIEDRAELGPRALLLTAAMRSEHCGLFVHGTGGYRYDRITEQWWQAWRGETLAPMALATADLHLEFDAPVCDLDTYVRAAWRAHHLPHNLDRALKLDVPRKRELLAHMDDDNDRTRKSAAFSELHEINNALSREHAPMLQEAQQELHDARAGIANRTIARRRDWCFALYPPDQLEVLVRTVFV